MDAKNRDSADLKSVNLLTVSTDPAYFALVPQEFFNY